MTTPLTNITLLIVLAYLLAFSDACFIRNCPIGGKRSGLTAIDSHVRQCESCGADNSGQCVNSHTCCGQFGCHLGTDDTVICRVEAERLTPCRPRGRACGGDGQSTCSAPGICCSEDYCVQSAECESPRPQHSLLATKTRLLELIGSMNRAATKRVNVVGWDAN